MLTLDEMKGCIQKINTITIYVKLRSFQYRLLMTAVITNIHLQKYGVKDTDLCTFCMQEKETIEHLLYDCKYVRPLWSWLQEKVNTKLDFSKIYLNEILLNPRLVENCIALLIKFYIYRTRCMGQRLSLQSCKNYIEEFKNIEEEIARSKGKSQMHTIKWSNFVI